jgi:hypothetical protein
MIIDLPYSTIPNERLTFHDPQFRKYEHNYTVGLPFLLSNKDELEELKERLSKATTELITCQLLLQALTNKEVVD